MRAVVGQYRPSATDVRPGTEPYERVIRALRGEPWNRAFGTTRTEGQWQQRPFTTKPPVHTSSPLSTPNTQVLKTRLLRNVSTSDSSCTMVAAPSAKRARCRDEEMEQPPTTAATIEAPSVSYMSVDHVTSSEEPFEQYVTGPVNPTDNQKAAPQTPPPSATTNCARLTQKLQKIAQLDDEVQPAKASQSKAKYKPPYKVIVDSRPGM